MSAIEAQLAYDLKDLTSASEILLYQKARGLVNNIEKNFVNC